ncbi:MAG: carbon-nitrogen hydrolase family protein [Nitriliruptoraceae bacterium]
MADTLPIIRAAAVQAAPVFLDREATTEKACALIRNAGEQGAQLIGFPEGFIPAHPLWFHMYGATDPIASDFSTALFLNAVEVPGPEVNALAAAARDAGAYVVIGVCEKLPGTLGTMYNTQVYLSPEKGYIGKHQKLVPTAGERLVHDRGAGNTFGTFETAFGPGSSMMCTENANPLAVFALTAEQTRWHVMSWPNYFPRTGPSMPEVSLIVARAFAYMSKAYVISACGVINDTIRDRLGVTDEIAAFLADPTVTGGSAIIAPDTSVIAGPIPGDREDIVCADLDLEASVRLKLRHDFAGHYNRSDVFQLQVNRFTPQLTETVEIAPALPSVIHVDGEPSVTGPPGALTGGDAADGADGDTSPPDETGGSEAEAAN